MIITLSIISGVLLLITILLGVGVYNLLKQVEQLEDYIDIQYNSLLSISNIIRESDKHLRDLDEKGFFSSDDDLGRFFESMKLVQKDLNDFVIKTSDNNKERDGKV